MNCDLFRVLKMHLIFVGILSNSSDGITVLGISTYTYQYE